MAIKQIKDFNPVTTPAETDKLLTQQTDGATKYLTTKQIIDTFREIANGVAGLDANLKVIKDPANATTTPTPDKIPKADSTGKIADGWIGATTTPTPDKIPKASAGGTIDINWLADAAITTSKLADWAVTNSKIADLAITTPKLEDGQVTTSKIADGNITTSKLANSSVTRSKLKLAEGSYSISTTGEFYINLAWNATHCPGLQTNGDSSTNQVYLLLGSPINGTYGANLVYYYARLIANDVDGKVWTVRWTYHLD